MTVLTILSWRTRPPVLQPRRRMHVQVMREGKEPHQGVGYMDDGTMIVVEQGATDGGGRCGGTSILNRRGRMVFAKLKKDANGS